MLVNIGDIWMLKNFIVVDMPETDDAQIILGRPILATTGCHIDVREGCISFEVEGRFAVFSHRKEDTVSSHLYWMHYPFSLSLIWRMSCMMKNLLILNRFYMRTLTKGMLGWNFLVLCHLTSPRLRPLFLMILR